MKKIKNKTILLETIQNCCFFYDSDEGDQNPPSRYVIGLSQRSLLNKDEIFNYIISFPDEMKLLIFT